MEQFEFPAKVISQGRITLPETWRELNKVKEGDIVISSVRLPEKQIDFMKNIDLYVYSSEYSSPYKKELTQFAVDKLRLAQFTIEKFTETISVSKVKRYTKEIKSNTGFILLGLKYINNGYGRYEINRGTQRISKFCKGKNTTEEGVLLYSRRIGDDINTNRLLYMPNDILDIRKERDADCEYSELELELLGLLVMPPGAIYPFENVK